MLRHDVQQVRGGEGGGARGVGGERGRRDELSQFAGVLWFHTSPGGPHIITHSPPSPLLLSRGFTGAASTMGSDLERALMVASEGGKLPIVVDTSPCLSQIKSQVSEPALKFALYEPVEFIRWGGERGGRGQGRCRGRAKEGAGCRSRLSSPRCTSRRRSSRCVWGGGAGAGQRRGQGGSQTAG